MSKQIYANAASALLAASITDTDLTIQVDAGYGALFPNPGAGEFFSAALVNALGELEIVKVTSRATDLLTVAVSGRGQEGTVAQAWTNGQTRVELRATKGTLDRFIQREGDTMSGDLDMDANDIVDARLSGDTVVVAGQTVGTKIRGVEDNATNEIDVPSDGTRATAGGQRILVQTDTALIKAAAFAVGQVIMWFGALLNIPAGWKVCDGTSGTPDLRDRFVVGAGTTYALSATGGAASVNSGAAGAHDHGAVTGGHALSVSELPAHHHEFDLAPVAAGGGPGVAGGVGTTVSDSTDTADTGGGGAHTHTITAEGTHQHTVATLPPYYGLYFIMYTG